MTLRPYPETLALTKRAAALVGQPISVQTTSAASPLTGTLHATPEGVLVIDGDDGVRWTVPWDSVVAIGSPA